MKQIMFVTLFLCLQLASYSQIDGEHIKALIKEDKLETFESYLQSNEVDLFECVSLGESSYSLLSIAIKYDARDIFNWLINQSVSIYKVCESKSPLMYAAKYNRPQMAEKLLALGADPKEKNQKGRSAYDYAHKYKSYEIIKIFSK